VSTRSVLARFDQVARQQNPGPSGVVLSDPTPGAEFGWMNTETARRYTDKPTRRAFVAWAKRAGLFARHCGRQLLYSRYEIDAKLKERRERQDRQHRPRVRPAG